MGFHENFNNRKRGIMKKFTPFLIIISFLGLLLFAVPGSAVSAGSSSSSAIQPGITVQLMYNYFEKDQGEDVHPEYSSDIRWRRIRPTLKGYILDGDLSFYLHGNTTPGTIELLDSYVDYKVVPVFRVRAGQYKIPFTRFRINSYKELLVTDWSICSTYFGAERQMGISLHNGYEKPMPIEYELGLFTGQNARKSHGVGLTKVSGEAVSNPSDLVEPGETMDQFHPAVALHLAYNYNDIMLSYTTDFEKTGPRFSIGASGVWDANPRAYRDFSLRLAPEFMFKAYGIGLSGTYYMGYYEPESEMNETNLAMTGGMIGGSYLIGKWVEISAQYSYVGTSENLRKDSVDHATAILEAAAADQEIGEDDFDALSKQYGKAGNVRAERETIFGINIYMIGRNLKLQNDISYLQHIDYKEDELNDLRFRTQLQFAY